MPNRNRFRKASWTIPPILPLAARPRLGSGALETLAVVTAVMLFGLAWRGVAAGPAPGAATPYPHPAMAPETSRPPTVWLVDGFNVLHAGILRGRDRAEWWTAPRRRELLARAALFEDRPEDRPEHRTDPADPATAEAPEIWVVFDGSGNHQDWPEAPAHLHQVFAPSADDWLVARVKAAPDPSRVVVVTRDRKVADRARHRGARVAGPAEFLARCRES